MEMSIDKATNAMKYYDQYDFATQRQAREKAVEVMRKYQKIEDIMHIEMNGKEALQEIERILRG